jgi:hypothetical protein
MTVTLKSAHVCTPLCEPENNIHRESFAEATRQHGELAAKVVRLEELLASTRAQCEHFLAEKEKAVDEAVKAKEAAKSFVDQNIQYLQRSAKIYELAHELYFNRSVPK